MFDANEMREWVDRAYLARKAAGHSLRQVGEAGFWCLPRTTQKSWLRVGGGIGVGETPMLRVRISGSEEVENKPASKPEKVPTLPLSVAEANHPRSLMMGSGPSRPLLASFRWGRAGADERGNSVG